MFRGLYTAWTGMANEQKRLDVISNNMANSNTVGYKDEKVASQAFDQVLGIKIRDGSQAYHNECIGSLSLGVKIGETYTDYSQGSVRQTGGTYDLALSGSGFFTVSVTDKAGEVHTRYTRDGRFHLTKDGLLVDADGNAVQGQNGKPDCRRIGAGKKAIRPDLEAYHSLTNGRRRIGENNGNHWYQ